MYRTNIVPDTLQSANTNMDMSASAPTSEEDGNQGCNPIAIPTHSSDDGKPPSSDMTPDIAIPVATPTLTIVCDGSDYNPKKPYLHVALWNHTVHPVTEKELGFDATSNRIIATVSLHDRCGFLVCSEKHHKAMQNLGYEVVRWGQTMAFPMCADQIEGMGTGEPYSGALTVHSFTEPVSLHNRTVLSSGEITGDGSFDGLNHLSGAYIPLALALQCATEGDTHVNLGTKNSGVNLQTHNMDVVVGANISSLTCQEGTGGSVIPDNQVIACKGSNGKDDIPLVLTSRHVRVGFDTLIQKMSGPASSYISDLGQQVASTIGDGIFSVYQKNLETDIREYATKQLALSKTVTTKDPVTSVPSEDPLHIDMSELPPHLQTSYCTCSMVGMQQPYPIGAPTVVVDSAAVKEDGTVPNDVAAAYGDRFETNCFALESHFDLDAGRDIHPFYGISALTHACILGQISTETLENIVKPFAKPNSKFLCCQNPACACKDNDSVKNVANVETPGSTGPVKGIVAGNLGRMLHGVSQNIALSSSMKRPGQPTTNKETCTQSSSPSKDVKCVATTNFCGTCTCHECMNTTKLLNLTKLVTSCTHAFQNCDNYVSDQTACSVDEKGVPQYMPTESMLPFMTLNKSIMMKTGPGGANDIHTRIGMNTDDCENCAFQGRSVLATLSTGASCVPGEHFHGNVPNVSTNSTCVVGGTAQTINTGSLTDANATHEETLRRMRIGNLPKQDQRRILLAAEVIGKTVRCNLGYFVTGAPSQSNDSVHKDSDKSSDGTKAACTSYEKGSPSSIGIDISSNVDDSLNLFGSKPAGQRISKGVTTNGGGGLSGHCTCTLSVMRSDGFLQTDLVENTGYVVMGKGDIPCEVQHRGMLTSTESPDNSDETAKKLGSFNGLVTIDNAVDVTVRGLLSTHVQTIATGLQVPGSNMRPSMFMGTSTSVSGNMDKFYKKIVSTGGYQCVQIDSDGIVQPGADVKKLVNQRVVPVIPLETAKKGGPDVKAYMGKSPIGLVQVVDSTNNRYKEYGKDCTRFRKAMAPPRAAIHVQDSEMLGKLGSPTSLKVNFPDEHIMTSKYGNNSHTFFVTHVPQDTSTAGHAKLYAAINTLVKHKNQQFVNVRFAKPIQTDSGEILTLYRIHGVVDKKN
jgi:hypothetical protein